MAKKPTVTTVASGYYGRQALNDNFEALRDAFDNTLSRDGSTPNAMGADFDMNGYRVLNAGQIDTDALYLNGIRVAPVGGVEYKTSYLTASYTGNGSTVAYALTADPQSEGNVSVYVDGVYQNKDTFSLSGTTLTFSEAPPLNAAIEIVYPTATDTLNGSTSSAIVYNQGGTNAQDRTVESRLRDFVSVKDFGGVCDGVTNDATALITALGTGKEVIIPETSYMSFSAGQVQTFIENLNLVSPKQVTEFLLPAGDHAITQQVELTNPDARNIVIKGDVKTQVSCTAVANTGGSAKNYSIRYTLSDASDVAIGDYLYVGYTAGTGNYNVVEGVWKVTGKSGNDVTVKHTLNAPWPTITVTDARVIPLKTILRWPKTQRGLAVSSCQLRAMENLVLASQFDITTESPVDSYSDGLQVGTVSDQLNTGSFESQQTNAGAIWMRNVGIVEWEGNGVQVVGGNAYFFQAAACSNGWRGFQAARNGSVGAKYCAAVGNGASGFQAEAMGFCNANGGVAAGNHDQGCYAIGPASVSFINGFSLLNVDAGVDARNFATILADGAKVDGNQNRGLYSIAGNILFGASATAANNTTADAVATEGGVINANGASSVGVVNIDYDSGSRIIGTDGEVIWPTEIVVENSTSQAKFGTTSIGDIAFSQDNAGAGFVNTLRIKNTTGTTYPDQDDTADLGRASERWKTVYATTGAIDTSDETEKQDIRDANDAEMRVARAIKSSFKMFRFKEAVTKKGNDARLHFGVIAQDVKAAFEAEGLDPTQYGIFCSDTWWVDADGNTYEAPGEGLTEVTRLGVRYTELLAFVVAAI